MDTGPFRDAPGTHDVGARVGARSVQIQLIVLRAADRWSPPDGFEETSWTLVRRAGRLRVDFANGSARWLDEATQFFAPGLPVMAITNVAPELAEVLLVALGRPGA